jgi:predicted metal-dependent hydrolase
MRPGKGGESDVVPELRLSHGTLPYEVHRRPRRTVGVVVRPDGRVEVHAPRRSTSREIRDVVLEFRPWIEKKRKEALQRVRRLRARRFDHGEEVPYLGRTLRLDIVEKDGAQTEPVVRDGRTLRVTVPPELTPTSRRAVARYAVQRWLLDEAREVFHRRHVSMARRVGHSARRVIIKDMRSRWGSCGPDRLMNLNWRLVLAPESVVDYVLVHELTHITVPNHSAAFWRRVGEACEHWAESRDWLRVHGDDLEL